MKGAYRRIRSRLQYSEPSRTRAVLLVGEGGEAGQDGDSGHRHQVLGFFDLPFQIVLTGELEGRNMPPAGSCGQGE